MIHRRWSIKKLLWTNFAISLNNSCVWVSFYKVYLTLLKIDSKTGFFLVNIAKFLRTSILKKYLETAAFVYISYLIYYLFPNSCRIITSCSAFIVQLCDSFFSFTCAKNSGNRFKQCENLNRKLKGINTSCFTTTPVKICGN